MKRAEFKIRVFPDAFATVSGLVNDRFGVHRDEDVIYYKITQLQSGMAMPGHLLFHKQAKAIADALDSAIAAGKCPDPFTEPDLSKNVTTLKEIFAKAEADFGYIHGDLMHVYRR